MCTQLDRFGNNLATGLATSTRCGLNVTRHEQPRNCLLFNEFKRHPNVLPMPRHGGLSIFRFNFGFNEHVATSASSLFAMARCIGIRALHQGRNRLGWATLADPLGLTDALGFLPSGQRVAAPIFAAPRPSPEHWARWIRRSKVLRCRRTVMWPTT